MGMQDQDSQNQSDVAYFIFDIPPAPETFVFKLTDPKKIQEARDILSGKQTEKTHVNGIVVKSPAPYNPDWTFHYDPHSISFFAFAKEVCDAEIKYVQENIDKVCGAFLPGCRWCPWGSRLLREISWSE